MDRVRELLQDEAVKNLDLNRADDAGYTPLLYSCILRLSSITKLLLEKGAGILDIMRKDSNGYCALHWAAMQLDNVALSYLTSNMVTGVDVCDNMERSALVLACVEGRDRSGATDPIQLRQCLTSLLASQANPNGILPFVSTPVQVSVCLGGRVVAQWDWGGIDMTLSDSLRSPGLALSPILFSVPYHISSH